MTAGDATRLAPATGAVLRDGRAVVLRALGPEDEGALGDFYESVPREDYRFYRCRPLDRALAREVVATAQGPTMVAVVAESDGAIVGYGWYAWKSAESERSVFGLCIARTHQGAGLGAVVMARLLEIAREIGPAIMSLTVQLANGRAVNLYQRMGFRVVREQMRNPMPDFPAEPEYYMERGVQ